METSKKAYPAKGRALPYQKLSRSPATSQLPSCSLVLANYLEHYRDGYTMAFFYQRKFYFSLIY